MAPGRRPAGGWWRDAAFEVETFGEFLLSGGRGLLVGYLAGLGSASALETGRMLGIFISSSPPLFVNIAFGKFGGDYFVEIWEFRFQDLGRLLVAHRFDAGGVRTGQTPLRAGHSNPC